MLEGPRLLQAQRLWYVLDQVSLIAYKWSSLFHVVMFSHNILGPASIIDQVTGHLKLYWHIDHRIDSCF